MTDETVDLLIHRHFEGALSPDEEALLARLLRDDPAAADRFVELSDLESGLVEGLAADRDRLPEPTVRPARRPRFRETPRSLAVFALGAAAALLLAALLFVAATGRGPARTPREAPAPMAREPERPVPSDAPEPEPPSPPPAPSFAPIPSRASEGKPPAPTPAPPSFAPAPSRASESKPPAPVPSEPKPAPPPPPRPPDTAPAPPRRVAVVLAELRGGLYRPGPPLLPLAAGARLEPGETVVALPRRDAHAVTDAGFAVSLRRGSSLRIEREEGGAVRLALRGTAYFEVERREAPLAVSTPHGEVQVLGTAFQVEADDRRAVVHVLEGSVRLRNEKGEALVKPGQRSSARAGERPAAAGKADVDAAVAWRRHPSLAADPARTPYVEHEPGANRRLAGVVVAAPFFEGEANAGALARAVAERADVGLVLGHHYRDLEKRIWVHLDRGLEAPVAEDRTIGETAASDRARKATADYLAQAKLAAGAAPVPFLLQFRDHNLSQGADELEVGEVAWSGWNRRVIGELKALYGALLERHRPRYRLELRFQGVDDAYEFRGQKRVFFFAELDARDEGYLAPRHSRNALTVFLNPGFLSRGGDLETYSKIFAELIEFLHARRR
jgi:ferric-dicitrate binding protein FerR (iron transport regulator)